jgi:hypothetical protein
MTGPDGGQVDAGPVADGGDAGIGVQSDGGACMGSNCGPSPGDPGWTCHSNTECNPLGDGICLTTIDRCTKTCNSAADCPVSWTCGPEGDGGPNVCQCVITSLAESCDGIDNDCNGEVDQGMDLCGTIEQCIDGSCQCPAAFTCGSDCVDTQTDPANCGGCSQVCPIGNNCVSSMCVCVTGVTCSNVCVDTTSDPQNCGACARACGTQEDCLTGMCVPPDREWARWSMLTAPTFTPGGTSAMPTVTDSVTGLTWTQNPAGMGDAVTPMTWSDAGTYCQGLGTGWRLPTRIELLSIVDYTQFEPAIDHTAFPQVQSNYFWTSTPEEGQVGSIASPPALAWAVDFTGGYSGTYMTSMYVQLLVLCVQAPSN